MLGQHISFLCVYIILVVQRNLNLLVGVAFALGFQLAGAHALKNDPIPRNLKLQQQNFQVAGGSVMALLPCFQTALGIGCGVPEF